MIAKAIDAMKLTFAAGERAKTADTFDRLGQFYAAMPSRFLPASAAIFPFTYSSKNLVPLLYLRFVSTRH